MASATSFGNRRCSRQCADTMNRAAAAESSSPSREFSADMM
jgi:hypothetical protein